MADYRLRLALVRQFRTGFPTPFWLSVGSRLSVYPQVLVAALHVPEQQSAADIQGVFGRPQHVHGESAVGWHC